MYTKPSDLFGRHARHSDVELLDCIAAGDRTAMHVLYQRHHDSLYAFIRQRSGNETTAQDITHDTMLEVWRRADRFAGKSAVRTWIFSIARNKMVDGMRKSSYLSYVDAVPDIADDAPDACTVIAAAQDGERVRACIARLKPAQAVAIRLAFFEGMTYEQISEVEDVPVGTVKTRIFHAKQALMHCLSRPA
ncbi:MAG: RNA polymerase [Rhodobacteraceae bacterium]|nr:RNA polymerase [Paracoccaceae bacterium]MAY45299.1 RNA polymerase [Paracoccaceae bacterium]QEW22315.1 Sigma-24 [Marinibacterium anthonyi]|tara:strand:- start:75 stop:647 length:573 start_codon:yes stop_codon:yes gene_type:complete